MLIPSDDFMSVDDKHITWHRFYRGHFETTITQQFWILDVTNN